MLADYLPEAIEDDRRRFPAVDSVGRALGGARIETVPIPGDCTDGFHPPTSLQHDSRWPLGAPPAPATNANGSSCDCNRVLPRAPLWFCRIASVPSCHHK